MPAFNEIAPKNLYRFVGTPDAPAIVDFRLDADFNDDPCLVLGAFRHRHTDMPSLVERLRDRGWDKIVVYCQKGRKISQGAAAQLRLAGFQTEVLAGGYVAWREEELPTFDSRALPQWGVTSPTRWVTRHRPKIDRIACPWLIKRFVDPNAEFLFVPVQDVNLVAEKFDAEPFDIEGVRFSHRGSCCSFDAVLSEFKFRSPALDRMAAIIRAADTDTHEQSPQAAGLLAISIGLSRMFKDDIAQLRAGLPIYDALYRWARDGFSETHEWPPAMGKP